MKREVRYMLFLLGFTLALAGCATPKQEPAATAPPREDAQGYLRSAQEYEKKGDLVEALRQYKLARTVAPEDPTAREGIARVEASLRASAEEHYNTGLKLHKQGKYAEARQEFMTALRLWPEHAGAADMLVAKKQAYKVKRFIVHQIQPGESISKLAQKYYGDYHKFPIIAEYNDMTDATQVHAGQKVKVPEVEGLPFNVGKMAVQTEQAAPGDSIAPLPGAGKPSPGEPQIKEGAPDGGPRAETAATPPPQQQAAPQEPEDQLAIYRDSGIALYGKKDYEAAIVELDKVLRENPEDRVALDYAYKAHFEYGMDLYKKEDYLSAKTQFAGALRYNSGCQQCHSYISTCETTYKELHYKRGMQFFDNEKLEDAIREWKLVKALDPNYKKVDYLINKAENIQKKVEELKGKGK
jgi:tetratricopeptide (TPR) repeat protein